MKTIVSSNPLKDEMSDYMMKKMNEHSSVIVSENIMSGFMADYIFFKLVIDEIRRDNKAYLEETISPVTIERCCKKFINSKKFLTEEDFTYILISILCFLSEDVFSPHNFFSHMFTKYSDSRLLDVTGIISSEFLIPEEA